MSFRYFDQKYGFELRRKSYWRLEMLSSLLQPAVLDIKKFLLHLFFFPFFVQWERRKSLTATIQGLSTRLKKTTEN